MKRLLKTFQGKLIIYFTEGNWRPVATVNFRPKELLGLGLVHLPTKCKSLIMRSIFKEFQKKKMQLVNGSFSEFLYGHKAELLQLLKTYMESPSAKELHQLFLGKVMERNIQKLHGRKPFTITREENFSIQRKENFIFGLFMIFLAAKKQL